MTPPRTLLPDLFAGVSVALVLIPQAIAYAELAGIPAIHGLVAAAVAPLAAALFTSSPALQTGPTAMSAVLVFAVLSPLLTTGDASYAAAAALLALMVGGIRVALGLWHAGGLAYVLSGPVLRGFTLGAAILIAASQVPSALGVARSDGRLLVGAAEALGDPSGWSWGAILTTAVAYALLRAGRTRWPRVPSLLLVAIAVTLVAYLFPGALGPTMGALPSSWPQPTLALPWGLIPELALGALVIAVVGFAEPTAIARRYLRPGEVWDPSRELLGQGLANLATGVSGGMPVGASFSRSALHIRLGARTRWGAVITGLTLLTLMPAAGLLSTMPRALLAAVVVSAIADLLRLNAVTDLWRFGRMQAATAMATALAVLTFEPRIDLALLIGVVLSVIVHLVREGQVSIERSVDGETGRIEIRGNLWFANAAILEGTLRQGTAHHPEVRRWRIDLQKVGWVDVDAALMLGRLRLEAQRLGIELEFHGADPRTRERLARYAQRPVA